MPDRHLGRVSTTVTKLYRTFGLLPWLSLLAFLAAIVAHSVSRLPGPYTWLEPLRTFRLVLAEPRFPFALLAVYWLGGWARRGSWDTQGAGRLLGRGDGLSALRAALLPGIARVLVALIADKVLLNSSRDVFDSIALGLLGLSVNAPRLNWKRLSEEAAYTAVCSTIVLVVCYAFTISKALIFMGGREFDAAIVHLESALFGFVPHRVLATWAALHPRFVQMFDWIYFHCFEHMALTTALLVALRRRGQRTEYLAALALCYLIGGLAYHLFPARGPGYFEPKYFEYLNEKSLITNHIRAWLKYNTEGVFNCTVSEIRTWNYIACMPSLHVTHEFIMLYYSRGSRLAFVLSATFTLLTLPAVVVLGWHYPLDVLAGGAVAVAAIAVARWQTRTLLPACFDLGEDETPACPKPVLAPFLRAYRAERRAHTARRD